MMLTQLLLVLQGEKGLQAVQGTKPAIITASRPITKMIVTQPKGLSSGSQSTATKIIPTKIVYGQQGKTQVRHVLHGVLCFCSFSLENIPLFVKIRFCATAYP